MPKVNLAAAAAYEEVVCGVLFKFLNLIGEEYTEAELDEQCRIIGCVPSRGILVMVHDPQDEGGERLYTVRYHPDGKVECVVSHFESDAIIYTNNGVTRSFYLDGPPSAWLNLNRSVLINGEIVTFTYKEE
jgi:hypothetical protein